jgi:nucleoporin POM152
MKARVSSVAFGTNPYFDSIGDQAEIKFTLIGEPPFSFTYQRSELSARKGGKVLETHTVSGVTTNEYSIFSALEG